jgi:hypothetical protein
MAQASESPTTSHRAVVLGAFSMPAIAAPAALAVSAPDPMFAVIENHKAAHSALSDANHRQCEIENALYDAGKRVGDARKDPRWDELQQEIEARDAELTGADWALVSIQPRTLAGVVALLRYVHGHSKAGGIWTDETAVYDDDLRTRSRSTGRRS